MRLQEGDGVDGGRWNNGPDMNTPIEKTNPARVALTSIQRTACTLFVIGLLGFMNALLSEKAVADEHWFLLEFADSKPPCLDITEGSRCIGTAPKTSVFEMRDGERLEMPTGTPVPPAWVALDRLWVYAPAVTAAYGRRAIELAATPMGARLVIEDGEYHYLQSIPLSRWTALETRNQPKLWVRVSPYSP